MKSVLITGATGLLGASVCTQLLEQGDKVRAIARDVDAPDAKALQAAGVDVVLGDVKDKKSLERAIDGMDGVIHSAAVLGRPGKSMEEGFPTNVIGTINMLSTAADAGVPVVHVLTTTFFDLSKPLSERSSLDLSFGNQDFYTVTKRLGFVEALARIAEGQDIRFMIPGAIYGPSICLQNGLGVANFNDRILRGVRGEMTVQLPLPMAWVTADDCAFVCIGALEKGARGERFIANGEIGTIAAVCNLACEIAGVPYRVKEIPKDQLDTPEIMAEYGPTMPLLAKKVSERPPSDTRFTQEKLGLKPTLLEPGLRVTLKWMKEQGAY
jgi:dihydroflavonol-4-reductase